jgi:hypothetical protein
MLEMQLSNGSFRVITIASQKVFIDNNKAYL